MTTYKLHIYSHTHTFLPFSLACAIELEDTVVVTGGDYPSVPFVNTYNIDGHQEQLPNMIRPRSTHACGYFVDSNNKVVSRGAICSFRLR